jgi:hypothetical protein
MRYFPALAILVLLSGLGGCGENATAVSNEAAAERGIFISSGDCADAGKLTIDQCGQAIDKAVTLHNREAASYKNLRDCAAVEGPDRCARDVDGSYRSNLQAFLVTMSTPASAVPLYASTDGSIGFRGMDKKAYPAIADGYSISAAAQAAAHENAKLKKRGS